jgi:hypothetical protein
MSATASSLDSKTSVSCAKGTLRHGFDLSAVRRFAGANKITAKVSSMPLVPRGPPSGRAGLRA